MASRRARRDGGVGSVSDRNSLGGNAEQVRAVADDLADAIIRKMDESDKGRSFHTDHAFIEWMDKRIVDKLKLWAAGIVLAYSVPVIAAAFVVGGMNEKLDLALRDQRANTQSLQARGGWMDDQERFNCELKRAAIEATPDAEIGDCRFTRGDDRTDARR